MPTENQKLLEAVREHLRNTVKQTSPPSEDPVFRHWPDELNVQELHSAVTKLTELVEKLVAIESR